MRGRIRKRVKREVNKKNKRRKKSDKEVKVTRTWTSPRKQTQTSYTGKAR